MKQSCCLLLVIAICVALQLPTGSSAISFVVRGESKNYSEPQARQSSCNYNYQFSNVNQFVNLTSENYPQDYYNNLNCRYIISSPRGTFMQFSCANGDFNVEASQNCQFDMFFWSLSGDPQFGDRRYACGQGQISPQNTQSNQLAIGFKSDASNPVSNFRYQYRCTVKVLPVPCSCGVSGAQRRIVGGVEAQRAEFPWRVALKTPSTGQFCGATIISSQWLMTAAHCVDKDNLPPGEAISAVVGAHDIRTEGVTITIDRIMANSQYNKTNQNNDIALLHLSRPLTFSQNIQPICLPWQYTSETFDNRVATASGWGTTYFAGPRSNVLRKVDLGVQSTQHCRQTYAGRNVEITDSMICAYRDNADTCQADSGGSLDWADGSTGKRIAIGVVSFGFGCAEKNTPGVYTQPVYYLGWIEQNSGDTFCKA